MADIKIKRITTIGEARTETGFEATGVETIDMALVKGLFGLEGGKTVGGRPKVNAEETICSVGQAVENARIIRPAIITPAMLKTAKEQEWLDKIIRPFDEIDIPLDTGRKVTFVVGCVSPNFARVVMKDCWDAGPMNEERTNKTGYYGSKGRKHVLEDIYPHIDQEWKDIIVPRTIVEIIDGERKEYADPMWLPSATDEFGPSEKGYWKDEGENFQLPIFKTERDRVKELAGEGTYAHWLRSPEADDYYDYFVCVHSSGVQYSYDAWCSIGFAPGFDI